MRLSPITIDKQEKSPSAEEQAVALAKLGAPCTVTSLDLGDYQWVVYAGVPQVILVERKTVSDLLNSVDDGRLTHFVYEPVAKTTTKVILIEELLSLGSHSRPWTPSQIDDLLVSVQVAGVIVIRASVGMSANRLFDFWQYTGKDEHTSLSQVVRPEITTAYFNPETRAAVRFLMGFPGVAEKRARLILDKYGSIKEALDHVTSWHTLVEGIGVGTSNVAREFLVKWHGNRNCG